MGSCKIIGNNNIVGSNIVIRDGTVIRPDNDKVINIKALLKSVEEYCQDYCSSSEVNGAKATERAVPAGCEDCPLTNWVKACISGDYRGPV
jgi:hypothetical protein